MLGLVELRLLTLKVVLQRMLLVRRLMLLLQDLSQAAGLLTFEDGFMQMFLLLLSGMRTASLLAIAMPFPTLTPSSRTNTILKIRDRILIVCNKVMLKCYCYYYYYYYDHDRHYYD